MSKVQQIRAEIEKILNEGLMKLKEQGLPPKGEQMTLKKLLSFIDSLPDVSETDFGKKEEPVSEDLEEELIKWHENHFKKKDTFTKMSGFYLTRESQLDLAKHFAQWQKQQMMKDAVDATARPDDKEIWADMSNLNLKDGDKVKILIIKED